MKPTRKQLEKQIQDNYQLIEKLETELREVCCEPNSMYSNKIKAEQMYYNWAVKKIEKDSYSLSDIKKLNPDYEETLPKFDTNFTPHNANIIAAYNDRLTKFTINPNK
jgi:hypothetical protein